MSGQLQLRRGTTAQNNTFTGAVGELTYNTDDGGLISHDGVTAGGYPGGGYLYEPGATVRNVQSKLQESVSVLDFGAVGNGVADDTVAIQAAVVSGAKRIYFPAGNYKISSAITITVPVSLWGDGPSASIIRQNSATANGLDFNFPTYVQGGGIEGITIESGAGWMSTGFQGSGSSGIGVKVSKSNGKFSAYNYGVHNFNTHVALYGCYYSRWADFEHLYGATNSILIDTSDGTSGGVTTAGNFFTAGKVSNFGFSGSNVVSVGIRITASGGDFFSDIDATAQNCSIVLQPTAGKQITYGFFNAVLADTPETDGWLIDATNGGVYACTAINCWAGFATNGAGLVTKGASLDGFRWVGGRLRENGKQGWHHQGGINCYVQDSDIASNGKLLSNTYDGVLVNSDVSYWGVQNCRVGNFASAFTTQANGISIAAGASEYFHITGNNFISPGIGKVPVVLGTSSTNYVVSKNLPLQAAGVNTSDRITIRVGTAGTPAAGSTVYVGVAGSYASVNANPFVCSQKGIITGFYIESPTAPGAGQSFTYTVVKNGVDTSMTGTISGAGSFTVRTTSNSFAVSAEDKVTLKLVTSASAALSIHNGSIYLEP